MDSYNVIISPKALSQLENYGLLDKQPVIFYN